MQIDLTAKQALVTGAAAGIGLAIAKGLAAAGADVTLVGRDSGRLGQAAAALRQLKLKGDIATVEADITSAAGCQLLLAQVPQIDILINNLGIYGAVPFFEISDDAWLQMLEVNLMSAVRLSRHYAQGMQQRGWGRIQFISSESALNIPAEMVHYGVSKAAMQGLSRGLAKVLAGSGVTVNSILPGPTRTEGAIKMMEDLAASRGVSASEMETMFLAENRPSSLLQRFATPEEVANLCVYVASEQASATTGAALRVDGGIVESIA